MQGLETDPAKRLLTPHNLSVVVTPQEGGDINQVTSMNDVRQAYSKDSQLAMDQNKKDVEGTVAFSKI